MGLAPPAGQGLSGLLPGRTPSLRSLDGAIFIRPHREGGGPGGELTWAQHPSANTQWVLLSGLRLPFFCVAPSLSWSSMESWRRWLLWKGMTVQTAPGSPTYQSVSHPPPPATRQVTAANELKVLAPKEATVRALSSNHGHGRGPVAGTALLLISGTGLFRE